MTAKLNQIIAMRRCGKSPLSQDPQQRRRLTLPVWLFPTLLLSALAHAQGLTPVNPLSTQSTHPPRSLADALRSVRPPDAGVILAVDAASITLPDGASTPAEANLTAMADAFGRLVQGFGTVTAVAPPTATLLNTNPSFSNIYDGLAPVQALELLAAGLDDDQWQAFTGRQGLGMDGLVNDAQRSLFLDLLPPDPLKVRSLALDGSRDAPPRDVSVDRPSARLRLGETVRMQLPSTGGGGFLGVDGPMPTPPGQPPQYRFLSDNMPPSTIDGVLVRADVPNTLKDGQLDYKDTALQAQVSVVGLKDVASLVHRAGAMTHRELYADRRYESRRLTVTGAASTASAADLLRALALCVTGTWRRVGPAYVLTDDIQGVGARRQILSEFHRGVEARRRALLDAAGAQLAETRAPIGLSGFGDPLGFSQAEQDQAQHSLWAKEYPLATRIGVPIGLMTPAQRAEARGLADFFTQQSTGDFNASAFQPDLKGKVLLSEQPVLQVLLPSLDGPVTLGLDLNDLFKRGGTQPRATEATSGPTGSGTDNGDVVYLLSTVPRRAVLAAPRTPDEVDKVVAAMGPLHLNQLWLPVFSHGTASMPGTPFSPAGGPDLLAYALKATRGTSISVFPVLNLLRWGPKPGDVADLDILGRTVDPGGDAVVSVFSPIVAAGLTSLVQSIAHEGRGGLVWRDAAPPGYNLAAQSLLADGDAPLDLGYTDTARLSFLRLTHVDPVDITDGDYLDIGGTDVGLPGYDGQGIDPILTAQWRQFRSAADRELLRGLSDAWANAAGPAGTRPPGVDGGMLRVLIHQSGHALVRTDWYGSWDNPQSPPPSARHSWDNLAPGQAPGPALDVLSQARTQSQIVYLSVPIVAGESASEVAGELATETRGRAWGGVMLDLSADSFGVDQRAELAALVPHRGVGKSDLNSQKIR